MASANSCEWLRSPPVLSCSQFLILYTQQQAPPLTWLTVHRRSLYNAAIIGRLVLTWFPNPPQVILGPLATVCDPYLNLFRGIIPPLGGTIDLSPILAFVVLDVSNPCPALFLFLCLCAVLASLCSFVFQCAHNS